MSILQRIGKVLRQSVRGLIVVAGVILLTSFSIDATDTFRTSQSALGILAGFATETGCEEGTTLIKIDDVRSCVDEYEAAVGEECAIQKPVSPIDTATNLNDPNCMPVSVSGEQPWRQVTVEQAKQLCARAHKRLLSAREWYLAAAGTPDNEQVCALRGALRLTGANASCISGVGAFDMVGNVWEYVDDTVTDAVVSGRTIPVSGYVAQMAEDGLPLVTASSSNPLYNRDYFWSAATGTYAIMRGGFYGSENDGGLYGAHSAVVPEFAGEAVGFRCIQDFVPG
jgi:formylglycine-generating enzyme required for sulfatase activity